jgi:hypothetical protein
MESTPMEDIEETLLLSAIAAEALHGRSQVNLDANFKLDKKSRLCEIDADNPVGRDIATIFTGFIEREFGESAFNVKRVGKISQALGEV